MIRQAPPEWLDLLGDWARPTGQMAHLDLWWDPDCHRWLVMECVPPEGVGDLLRLQLFEDPHRTPFRTRQAEAYRATGRIPLAFWIIQGDQGGHRLQYGEHEATLAQFYGGSREPPAPGSLPYAPFDRRVMDALRGYDRVMSKFATLQAAYAGDAQAALEQMRRDMLADTADAVRGPAREASAEVANADIPITDGPPPDYEQVYDRFITTGDMPAHTGSLSSGGAVTVPFEP